MNQGARHRARLANEVNAGLAKRLRARQLEVEEAIFARVRPMSGSAGYEDAEYQAGLRAAVVAVVDYSLTCIEQGEEWLEPIPSAAIAQAHRAARNGVDLDTIVFRYIAGHRLLGEFVMDEADRSGFLNHGLASRDLRRRQEAVLERVVATIANEYKQERERVRRTAEQRRREIVQRLLAGEPTNRFELEYEFDAWHLGVIAYGARADKVVQSLADGLGRQLLLVACGEGTVWAWLGGHRKLSILDVERQLSSNGKASASLTIGEPGQGIDGWRLTHRQAQRAHLVALRRPQQLTLYAEHMLLAAALRDCTLAKSLEDILSPLGNGRNGPALRETLRVYFAAGHNVKVAADKLVVDRNTVRNRLDKIEQRLGYLPRMRQAELEVALRLEGLREVAPATGAPIIGGGSRLGNVVD